MKDPRCPEMTRKKYRAVTKKPASQPDQLFLRLSPPKKLTADDVVRSHMLSVFPPSVPPPYSEIVSAEFSGVGRKRLTMFDGLKSTVEVFLWGAGAAGHRWLAWDGGDASLEAGRWVRVPAEDAI